MGQPYESLRDLAVLFQHWADRADAEGRWMHKDAFMDCHYEVLEAIRHLPKGKP